MGEIVEPTETANDRAITGADLQALIREKKVLRGAFVQPSARLLDALGRATTIFRNRQRVATKEGWTQEEIEHDALRQRAFNALRDLGEVLPIIRANLISEPERLGFDSASNQWCQENLEAVDVLAAQVTKSRPYPIFTPYQELSARAAPGLARYSDAWAVPLPPRVVGKRTWWHEIALPLAGDFCRAVQAANPNKRIGNSHGGPLSRFLVAVIPLVTGENASLDAVRKHLASRGWENPP